MDEVLLQARVKAFHRGVVKAVALAARRDVDVDAATALGEDQRRIFAQYTSADFTDALDDHGILASLGSVGDAYDNAMAESFVDTFKTELIADRVWRTKTQLELAIVKWVGWYNHTRLHGELADIPPIEHEAAWRTSKTVILAGSEDQEGADHVLSSLRGP